MSNIEVVKQTFSSKLRKLLEDKEISQNKLANNIGIDRASINKYLSGESVPRLDTFLAICDELNVQPNYFLNISYNDYSADSSKTEERKIIESLYCLAKHNFLFRLDQRAIDYYFDYGIQIYNGTIIGNITQECMRYATSDLADNVQMCKKIADKYEPILLEESEKNDCE